MNKDNKGRYIKSVWNSEKEKILVENYSSIPKKKLCELLGVNLKQFSFKVRELKLNNIFSFDQKFKECSKCKNFLPRTTEYFSTNKDGDSILFRSACKKCTQEISNKNQSSVEGYLKSLLYSKKSDKRVFEGKYEIDINFLLDLYNKQNGKCAITGIEMKHDKGKGFNMYNISIDRINPKITYTKNNTQLVCLWANVSKNYLTNKEFKKFIDLTFFNLNKIKANSIECFQN